MSDHFDRLRAAIARAEAAYVPPPMDAIRLLCDLCQVLDPIKRDGLRTLIQELKANFLAKAPAVVSSDLWRECCEKQRREVPAPPDQPAAPTGGGEDESPPDSSSDAPWRCNWCKISKTRNKCRGPGGPKTLCNKCYKRWRSGATGPRRRFECRWCNATSTGAQWAGPTGKGELCHSCGQTYDRASPGVKMLLYRLETELERLKSENERLSSVPVINAETGAETRETPPKRARGDGDAAPASSLEALKTVTDATVGKFAEVKSENAALEGQRDRNDATAAAASAAAATANAAAATANDDAEEAQDTLGYQVRFTDALQTKIDELHALACQVDPVAADAIKNREAT